MPLHSAAYNTDWIISNTSNVHVTNSKEWFFNYTPFRTETTSMAFSDRGMEVVGVGDVRLEINAPTKEKGSQAYATLVLRNVLYCPTGVCNILGLLALPAGYEMTFCKEGSELTHKKSGVVYLVDNVKLWKLWLVGQPKGQTSLKRDVMYYINACWSEEERMRFAMHKAKLESGEDTAHAQGESPLEKTAGLENDGGNDAGVGKKKGLGTQNVQAGSSSKQKATLAAEKTKQTSAEASRESSDNYTPAEKKWLKKHFGKEFKFLRTYGLSIYDEEDRAEGRAIARALMEEEED